MDILKVGSTLGIGTIAWWDGAHANRVAVTDSIHCRIAAAGPLLSRIHTDYFRWKAGNLSVNLHSDLSITAGSRMTRHLVNIKGALDNLCTGLLKLPDTELIPPPADGEWCWLATWGVQSLNNDLLGMAIFFRRADLISNATDDLNCTGVTADLSREESVGEIVSAAQSSMGSIDILINSAGIIHRQPLLEFSEKNWDDVLKINLRALFFLSQAAVQVVVKQGRGGRIINIASMLSFQGRILVPSYTAAKSAVMGLTRALANELALHDITANAIAPG